MPDKGHDGGEVTDALADVYTTEQSTQILATVRWRPDVRQDKIARVLDSAASWHGLYRRTFNQNESPSVRERRLNSTLRKKLDDAAVAIRNLPQADRDLLIAAGYDLAQRDGELPDVQPESVPLPGRPGEAEPTVMKVWDVAQQIEACRERLDWLVRCTTRAVERTVSEKAPHGSPVPDHGLHITIGALHKVYFDYAADPRNPGTDIGDGSPESATWRESELLDFLSAALQPL